MKKLVSVILVLAMVACACSALADKGFAVQNIKFDTAILAKAAVPDGYQIITDVNCCDETTCIGYPIRVSAVLANPDTDAFMFYYSGESYLQRVRNSSPLLQHADGQLDGQLMIFMLQYMNAYDYCLFRASLLLQQFFGIDAPLYDYQADTDSFSKVVEARTAYVDSIVSQFPAGFNFEGKEVSACERVFTFSYGGQTYCFSVMAEDYGYQYSSAAFDTCNILWEVPYYFALVCPESEYSRIHDTDYRIFRENTGINDEFKKLSDDLNDRITAQVIAERNMQCAYSMAYMEAMTNLTFSIVEGTLGGTYSSTDRFSDYIFDQNDYTTLDGDHVKVSTSYDYVYQIDSNVYYTNDAFAVPDYATRLYPNP